MDLTIANFQGLINKAEGRDKLARIFQYGARAIVGFVARSNPAKGSALAELGEVASNLMKKLADARRTHRFCKEIAPIQAIPKALKISNPVDMVLEVSSKVTLATFMIIDHIAWLKQINLIKSGRKAPETIQLGLKVFMVSNMLSTIINAKKLAALNDDQKDSKDAAQKAVVKHALLSLQCAHTSKFQETDDFLVGIAGVITSIMDTIPQWPKSKA